MQLYNGMAWRLKSYFTLGGPGVRVMVRVARSTVTDWNYFKKD
jgi:hypothetical protein